VLEILVCVGTASPTKPTNGIRTATDHFQSSTRTTNAGMLTIQMPLLWRSHFCVKRHSDITALLWFDCCCPYPLAFVTFNLRLFMRHFQSGILI
jgi:hypothetical protein